MEFKTLDELLSLDDVKRLGMTHTKELTFKEYTLQSQFSKGYQQKQVFEDLRVDLIERLLSYSPLFQCVLPNLNTYLVPISISQKEDGSFWFHYSYFEVLSFFLTYFICKYKMKVNEVMPDFSEEKLSDENKCEKLQEFFLNVFKKVNQSFNKVGPSKQEQVIEDRKFAKFLYKNTYDLVELLKQPLTLPILEDIDKDRFLLALSLQAIENLKEMENEEVLYSDSVIELSIGYLDRYFTITKYLSEKANQPYDFSFASFGEFHSYQEVVNQYQWCVQNFSETIEKYHKELDMGQIFREYLKDARTKIKKDEFVKAIQLRFELFPKGEGKVKGQGVFARKSVVSEDIKRLLEEKYDALLEEKFNFYPTTDYLWVLEEAQSFSGYRGYVYPNGKVIFEKFYRKTRNGLAPTRDESFIAMDILDFIEMAPKSKTELIDFIRSQRQDYVKCNCHVKGLSEQSEAMEVEIRNPNYRDIRRHYHVPGWQKKAQAIIEEDPKEYDFDLIETILSEFSNVSQVGKQYIK